MSRRHATKEIQERRQEFKSRKKQIVQSPSLFRSFVDSIWGFAVASSVVIGLLSGGYYFFRPSIEIIPPAPIFISANDDLFSNPFIIRASSVWLPLKDLEAVCHVVRVTREHRELELQNNFHDFADNVATLEAGEEHSVSCGTGFKFVGVPVLSADVVLEIRYTRPWFYFGRTYTRQGFQAVIRNDKAYWTPKQIKWTGKNLQFNPAQPSR